MKGIWVILKKDLVEYWIIPVIFVLIPLLVFYIVINDSSQFTLGVYGDTDIDLPVETKQISNISQGIKQVENGELDAFFQSDNKRLYTTEKGKEESKLILYLLSEPAGNIKEISVRSTIDPQYIYWPLLCVMTLIMTGFIGAPIAILYEKEENMLQSLLLSPLTYKKLIIEKAVFGFIISFSASLLFLLFTVVPANIVGVIVILFFSSFLFSFIALLFGILFSEMETMFGFLIPLLLIILFAEINSSFNNYNLQLPVSRALYKLVVVNEIPLFEGSMILVLCILMALVDGYILRRTLRRN